MRTARTWSLALALLALIAGGCTTQLHETSDTAEGKRAMRTKLAERDARAQKRAERKQRAAAARAGSKKAGSKRAAAKEATTKKAATKKPAATKKRTRTKTAKRAQPERG